jgi:chromosome segregation ATPase
VNDQNPLWYLDEINRLKSLAEYRDTRITDLVLDVHAIEYRIRIRNAKLRKLGRQKHWLAERLKRTKNEAVQVYDASVSLVHENHALAQKNAELTAMVNSLAMQLTSAQVEVGKLRKEF